jgi:anti-anti-sigma factor
VLSVQHRRDGDRYTLLLSGELDIAAAPQLEKEAQKLLFQQASELVLDLSKLEFIDSAGLNAILKVRTLCQEHMCEFGLTPGAQPVQRLFEITRLIDRLPFRKARHGREQGLSSPEQGASPELGSPEPEPEL